MSTKPKIGDTVWLFDLNRRVYPPPPPGCRYSTEGPIWKEHWGSHTIVGETARSWVLDRSNGQKIPKRNANPRTIAFSREDIDRQARIRTLAPKLSRLIEQTYNYDTLQAVARLLGYQGEETA